MNYLIYHRKREVANLGDLTVYHDSFKNNQDPYIWNERFLHSFCHITQLTIKENDLIFWVSGDTYPDFSKLYCDCVFVIETKVYWNNANSINEADPIVENKQTFEHHYNWVNPPHRQHVLKNKKRFTLKANKDKSFQPQDNNRKLIDIIPFLNTQGFATDFLRNSISKTKNGKRALNSSPFPLTVEISNKLYQHLFDNAVIKIKGEMIENKHPFKTI
jgi:hypothetical protein